MPNELTDSQKQAFLDDLTQLSLKHGIVASNQGYDIDVEWELLNGGEVGHYDKNLCWNPWEVRND